MSLTQHNTTEFNQQQPPAYTITAALDTSKAFDIVNIHYIIEKFKCINIIKFIANFIKEHKAYTNIYTTSIKNWHFPQKYIHLH